MKVLYLTNIHNPYRDEFFNQLGNQCELTVLFEERSDPDRDSSWFEASRVQSYRELYLSGSNERQLLSSMIGTIGAGWSVVVIGCYNRTRQIIASEFLKFRKIPFVVNSDGLAFDNGGFLKRALRRHVLRGASSYLVAGSTCASSLRRIVGDTAAIAPYPFSSLTQQQINELSGQAVKRDSRRILVVGQYQDYKGLDVALAAAKILCDKYYFLFVGAGKRVSELKLAAMELELSNVEFVSFMKPEELKDEYLRAGAFVLPSRQECWGLVVNEAAACGCPIISTWGSGAAVEFLSGQYPQFLAAPDNAMSLAGAIEAYFAQSEIEKSRYSAFLKSKATDYSIEHMVEAHMKLLEEMTLR